jgi:hypothetical protein
MIVMIGATVLHAARGDTGCAITTAILFAVTTFVAYMLEGEADRAANHCVSAPCPLGTLPADRRRRTGASDRSGDLLPCIKSVARVPDSRPVRLKQRDKAEHRFRQSSAERCELVLHLWRHLCVDVTREHVITLEHAKAMTDIGKERGWRP